MKKMFFRVFVFIVLIFALDQIVGAILNKLYFTQRYGRSYSLTHVLQTCKADILIFGSSQAQHNFDPRIIADSLNMSCYNAGQDGGHSILLHSSQIGIVLKRYSPKIIILELGSTDVLKYRRVHYEKLAILRPYVSLYPELRSLLDLVSPYEQIIELSKTYTYNSTLIDMIRLNTDFDKNRNWMIDGFIPVYDKVFTRKMLEADKIDVIPDSLDMNKVNALKNIIVKCYKQKVRLVLVISPLYADYLTSEKKMDHSATYLLKLIKESNVEFLDFERSKDFVGEMNLFVDRKHLNAKGTIPFTNLVVSYLK